MEKRYNESMTENNTHQQEWGPDIVGYFTLVSVAVGSFLTLPEGASIGLIILNFGLIAGLMYYPAGNKPLRQRLIYLGLFTALSTTFFFLGVNPGIYQILFFIISAQAMMLLPFSGALLWLLLLALISGGAFWAAEGLAGGLLTMIVYSGGYMFFGIFGRSLMQAQLAKQRSDELLTELQQTHQQLQEYVLQVEQLAVAEERNRLAREMHDAIGHRLTVSAVQLEGAQRLIEKEPHRAEEMVGTVREQVREALTELRQTVATLREPLETGLDLKPALISLIDEFEEATDLTVNLLVPDNLPSLPDSHRLTLYRTAQEALTNVQRHAEAKQVWVQIFADDHSIKLSVGDDGLGFSQNPDSKRFGLRGMQERASQIGGECSLDKRSGGGAQITVTLPLVGGRDGS